MKKLILIYLVLSLPSIIQGQNSLSLNFEMIGVTTFKMGTQDRFLSEQHYFGLIEDFSIHKKVYPYFSLGLSYKTPSVSIFNRDYYLMTALNIKYENNKNFYFDRLLLTGEIYFPVRVKERKFRIHYGFRSSIVLSEWGENLLQRRYVFPINKYRYGGLALFKYQLTQNLDLGLNIYVDFKEVAYVFSSVSFRTMETGLRIAYHIW